MIMLQRIHDFKWWQFAIKRKTEIYIINNYFLEDINTRSFSYFIFNFLFSFLFPVSLLDFLLFKFLVLCDSILYYLIIFISIVFRIKIKICNFFHISKNLHIRKYKFNLYIKWIIAIIVVKMWKHVYVQNL